MRTVAVLLAAGRSERFGQDKLWIQLGGAPLWTKSYRTLLSCQAIEAVGIVCQADRVDEYRALAPEAAFVVVGGQTRTQSAKNGFEACPDWAEAVLFHDAARPFVSHPTVHAVASAVASFGAAFPSIEVTDTVKLREDGGFRTLDRSRLVAVQTPQGATVENLRRAFASGAEATDDAALLEAAGVQAQAVPGDPANIKVTNPGDIATTETRTGIGYDVHRFSDDPSRPLWLGGVLFEGVGLEGHSDADAVLHAVVDALLGAACLGDIGQHFPDSDARWKGEPSATFLKETSKLLAAQGWDVVNIDISLIAERPRVAERRDEIRSVVAALAGIGPGQVSVKATTNEGLGAIGRGEGVAAFAVATVTRAV
jgi:2-C-methyl-D-erythritol 4-phosphate cytidylyltransferase/2-C-methyl-D-erythritol 2,4-cyclodiphosphate synthase